MKKIFIGIFCDDILEAFKTSQSASKAGYRWKHASIPFAFLLLNLHARNKSCSFFTPWLPALFIYLYLWADGMQTFEAS